jgi:hypothetical protein
VLESCSAVHAHRPHEERGGAVVVRGEPGIGKSALLAAAKEQALERGVTVVSTTGAVSESRLAFAGLHQLLLPMLGRLDLLPEPQRRALATAFGIEIPDGPNVEPSGAGVDTPRHQTPHLQRPA